MEPRLNNKSSLIKPFVLWKLLQIALNFIRMLIDATCNTPTLIYEVTWPITWLKTNEILILYRKTVFLYSLHDIRSLSYLFITLNFDIQTIKYKYCTKMSSFGRLWLFYLWFTFTNVTWDIPQGSRSYRWRKIPINLFANFCDIEVVKYYCDTKIEIFPDFSHFQFQNHRPIHHQCQTELHVDCCQAALAR